MCNMFKKWLIVAAWGLAACSSSQHDVTQVNTPPSHRTVSALPTALVGDDRQQQEALQAFLHSCPRLGYAWQSLCLQASITPKTHAAATRYFQRYFDEYQLDNEPGLLTGYMEAQLRCSWHPTSTLNYPVYAPPADLRKGRPYLTRRQIDQSPTAALRKSVLMYCDKFDAFVLDVQGSGRVVLPDLSSVKLTYATKNNRAYTSIGKVLIDAGEIPREQMSMQAIRQWVRQHPDRMDWLLWHNDSMVFYHIDQRTTQPIGPPGAMALKEGLMPFRSVAVDSNHIPLGTPLKIRSQWPDQTRFARVVVAQDKGGAIKGRVRADLFLGHGDLADELAGRLQSPLELRVLWPKTLPVPDRTWQKSGLRDPLRA